MAARTNNSRQSARRAGWDDNGDPRTTDTDLGTWKTWLCREREAPKWDRFSWLTVRALFESINDQFAKLEPDLINGRRLRWVANQRAAGMHVGRPGTRIRRDFWIDHTNDNDSGGASFFLVGDTGEQDASQYVVAPLFGGVLDSEDADGSPRRTAFTVIVSDVIYPAGDINEYINGFYIPYRRYQAPIYAIPGNHDWYDGLNGFMYHFCAAEPLPLERFRKTNIRPVRRMASYLWRGAESPKRPELAAWRDSRRPPGAKAEPLQPAPYFAIDTEDLLIVAIDSGVAGDIDDEQGRWLLRTSAAPKQKILLTGKPIYVDNCYKPGLIGWEGECPRAGSAADAAPFRTVDDIVRNERFGYIAAIGGDVHNYQRYPVWHRGQKRFLQYFVSGGGGAYLSPTHRIPAITAEPKADKRYPWPAAEVEMPTEDDAAADDRQFRCYPLRGDSLAYFARSTGRRMFNALLLFAIAFCAAAWLYTRLPSPTDNDAALDSARLGALALFGGLVAGAIVGALFAAAVFVVVRMLKSKRASAPVHAQRPHHPQRHDESVLRLAMRLLPLGVVLSVVAAAWAVDHFSAQHLLTDGQFWVAVALALAVPALFVGIVLVAHDLHGSLPANAPDLFVVVPSIAAAWVFVRPPDAGEAPAWVTALALSLIGAGVGLAGLWGLRRGSPRTVRDALQRVLLVAAPAFLVASLAHEFESTWLGQFLIAMSVPFLVVWSFGRDEVPAACDQRPVWLRKLDSLSSFLVVLGWIAVAMLLLGRIGHGWITTGLVAGGALLVLTLILLLFVGLVVLTSLTRVWLMIFLAPLMLVFSVWSEASSRSLVFFIAAGVFAIVAAGLILPLRPSQMNAKRAGKFIADQLGHTPVARNQVAPPEGWEKELARLLFPYASARTGGGPRVGLPAEVSKKLAELGDDDQPPFFKHILRVDQNQCPPDERGCDRELVISCYGATGYLSEENDPPLEDRVRIPFKSTERFSISLGPSPTNG